LGKDGIEKLQKSSVILFGVGGVGSFAAEALGRTGIGRITLIDYDQVCLTNVNRQLHAFPSTVGKIKVEEVKKRLELINPRIQVRAFNSFYGPETENRFWDEDYDYILDAIDTVSAKLLLAEKSVALKIPIIMSMGAGNKLDPTRFRVVDISKTHTDPLAKVIRKELRKRGITKGIKAVFSDEPPIEPYPYKETCYTGCICPNKEINCAQKRSIPGSVAFVPSVAGLIMAGTVIRDLTGR
jgi:tRNA A37 threonylcarbamoyladenosine dehydratase